MADPVLVRHPDFDTVVEEVPADSVKDWTDAGWERVTRGDEGQLREQLERFDPPPTT